jgi:hypothetical protein
MDERQVHWNFNNFHCGKQTLALMDKEGMEIHLYLLTTRGRVSPPVPE